MSHESDRITSFNHRLWCVILARHRKAFKGNDAAWDELVSDVEGLNLTNANTRRRVLRVGRNCWHYPMLLMADVPNRALANHNLTKVISEMDAHIVAFGEGNPTCSLLFGPSDSSTDNENLTEIDSLFDMLPSLSPTSH